MLSVLRYYHRLNGIMSRTNLSLDFTRTDFGEPCKHGDDAQTYRKQMRILTRVDPVGLIDLANKLLLCILRYMRSIAYPLLFYTGV
jgi:hypothetical protein